MNFNDSESPGVVEGLRSAARSGMPWSKLSFFPTQPQVALWNDGRISDRYSLAKDIRWLPIQDMERGMKETGVLPIEQDISDFIPPHMARRKQKKTINGLPVFGPKPKPQPKRRARRGKVQVASPGYPSMAAASEQHSLAVAAPTARSLNTRSGLPAQSYRPNGDCVIKHREFIRDINGSVNFAATGVSINPGLSATFNWLSGIATRFESYQFLELCFSYETQAPTTTSGSVVLAIDYDPRDPLPTSKAQAMDYRGTVRSAPWTPCQHESIAEDLRKRKTYYVRSGSAAPNEDLSLYDTGTLSVITQAQAGATVIGELWAHYTVKLMTPKSNSAGGGTAIWGEWNLTDNVTTTLVGGNLPAALVQAGGSPDTHTFTFSQPWQGVVSVDVQGTGITLGAAQLTGTGVVAASQQLQNNGAATAGAGYAKVNASQGQTVIVTFVNTTITGGGIVFSQGLGATS